MADNIVLIGCIGLFLGIALRTLAPFAQKYLAGKITWNEFLNRFLALAGGAYVASAALYLDMAPLSNDVIRELLWTFLIGVAGNEIFNRVYHFYEEVIKVRAKANA